MPCIRMEYFFHLIVIIITEHSVRKQTIMLFADLSHGNNIYTTNMETEEK